MHFFSLSIIFLISINFFWFLIINFAIWFTNHKDLTPLPFIFKFLEIGVLYKEGFKNNKLNFIYKSISLFIYIQIFILELYLKAKPSIVKNYILKQDLNFSENRKYEIYTVTNKSFFNYCTIFHGYKVFFILLYLRNLKPHHFFEYLEIFSKQDGILPIFINNNFQDTNFQKQFIQMANSTSMYQSIDAFNLNTLSKEEINRLYASLFFLNKYFDFKKDKIKESTNFINIINNGKLTIDLLENYSKQVFMRRASDQFSLQNFEFLIKNVKSLENLLVIKLFIEKNKDDFFYDLGNLLELINSHDLMKKTSYQILDIILKE